MTPLECVFPIVLKTKDQICEELPIIMKQIEFHTGQPVKSVRTDDGPEFARLKAYFDEKGVFREKSAPYAQHQDGVSERSIRTIIERARTMISHANLPVHLWPEAMAAAVYITNLLDSLGLIYHETINYQGTHKARTALLSNTLKMHRKASHRLLQYIEIDWHNWIVQVIFPWS